MSRYPAAIWRGPIPNQTGRGMGSVYGVVLHIMSGTLTGTDSWFHNPAAQASAHFGVGKTGTVYQWVDTADKAWAQAAGNPNYLSIEHEGNAGDSLTPAQLDADAKLIEWMANTHGFPLALADAPGQRGVGYHAMGGAAWGGHPSCPGGPIIDQRQTIISRIAGPGPAPTPAEDGDVAHVYLVRAKGDGRWYEANLDNWRKRYVPSPAIANALTFGGIASDKGDPFVWPPETVDWLFDETPDPKPGPQPVSE